MPVLQKKALFSAFIICQVLRIIQNYMEVSPAKSLILSATIHGGSYFFIQPFHIFQNILSGKWKITILWYIAEYKVQRFGELRRRLGDITQSTLTKQLRELEQDGFVSRYVYQEVPPKVEYSLTELGKSFVPILQDMKKWSDIHLM